MMTSPTNISNIIFLVSIAAIAVSGKKSLTNNNVKNTRIIKFKIVESLVVRILFYCNMVLMKAKNNTLKKSLKNFETFPEVHPYSR